MTKHKVDAMFSPPEAVNAGVAELKRIEERAQSGDVGIRMPIAGLRDYVAPMMRGQIMSVIGQASNGKSYLLDMITNGIAKDLAASGRSDWAIVKVSTEDLIEEQMMGEFARETGEDLRDLTAGRVNWDAVYKSVYRLYTVPIYRIGDSLARGEDAQALYMANIANMIRLMQTDTVYNTPVKIAAIVIDYLQALPFDPQTRAHNGEDKRRLQVRNDIYEIRNLAKIAPVFLGVQAKQTLSGGLGDDMQCPGMYDGEESSSIGQRSDRILSVWMPKVNKQVGTMGSYRSKGYEITDNLQFVRVVKQRGHLPAGRIFMNYLDYEQKNKEYVMEEF